MVIPVSQNFVFYERDFDFLFFTEEYTLYPLLTPDIYPGYCNYIQFSNISGNNLSLTHLNSGSNSSAFLRVITAIGRLPVSR